MNTRLALDPNKLNPKFDGYKLKPFSEISNLYRSNLFDNDITVYNDVKSDHRMGFRDLQARIRYSQLVYGYPLDAERGSAFCIDQEFNLHMIIFNKASKQTSFHLLTQLIKPLGPVPGFTEPDSTVPIQPQIPSAIAISRELVLVSNGVGDIELIGLEEKNGKMLGVSLASVCYLGDETEGISPVPCMLLTAKQVKSKIMLSVYSHTASKTTEFNIATMEMDIPTNETEQLEDGSFVLLLEMLHMQRGSEVPVYAEITPSGQHVIFASETKYNKVHHGFSDQVEPMEIVKETPPVPAYQWSQEGADITVLFQLPLGTEKSAINCKFVTDHLVLLVQDSVSYPYRKLWSTVKPEECLWTYEAKSGLLSLFMTKMDEYTRWPQLFDKDDGVLETISPTNLADIKSKLDKFTAEEEQVPEGTMVLKPSLSHPTQHPAATDMDEDVDDASQPILFSVYNIEGNVVDEFSSGNFGWLCKSYPKSHHISSVCLQMDVDGLVFEVREVEGKVEFTHEVTFDAFAFVQASKRDARFVLHDPHFYFTSIIESSRNAYIYFHHDDKRDIETQTLIDLTQGDRVDVLGTQLVLEKTLMILTESQVIVIEL